MIYRLADKDDLPRLLSMVEQAKVSFRARGIGQWQKGDPDGPGLLAAIGRKTVHVLDEEGQAIGMITVVQGPEASYRDIDGAWLNDGPYAAFHRVCVEKSGYRLCGSLILQEGTEKGDLRLAYQKVL